MADAERIQLPERGEIVERALESGVPRVIAERLGMTGGESRSPDEIIRAVAYVVSNQANEDIEGLASTDSELGQILLDHYPGAVDALVPNGTRRKGVMGLWEREQKPLVEAGYLRVADWHQ